MVLNVCQPYKKPQKYAKIAFNITIYVCSPCQNGSQAEARAIKRCTHTHIRLEEYQWARLNGRLSCVNAGPLQRCIFSAFGPKREWGREGVIEGRMAKYVNTQHIHSCSFTDLSLSKNQQVNTIWVPSICKSFFKHIFTKSSNKQASCWGEKTVKVWYRGWGWLVKKASLVKPRYSFLWLINFVWHSVLFWIVVQILKMHSLHKAKLHGCL